MSRNTVSGAGAAVGTAEGAGSAAAETAPNAGSSQTRIESERRMIADCSGCVGACQRGPVILVRLRLLFRDSGVRAVLWAAGLVAIAHVPPVTAVVPILHVFSSGMGVVLVVWAALSVAAHRLAPRL